MRKIADVATPKNEIVRVMIYDDGTGVYLFLYDRRQDGPCCADHWFESVADAEAVCVDDFAIKANDWKNIPDPQPGCQHDWINPTRVKRDREGNNLWEQFERVNDAV